MTTWTRYGIIELAPYRKSDKQVSAIEQPIAQDKEMHCTLYYYIKQRIILCTNNKASCYVQHTQRDSIHAQKKIECNNNTHAQRGRKR